MISRVFSSLSLSLCLCCAACSADSAMKSSQLRHDSAGSGDDTSSSAGTGGSGAIDFGNAPISDGGIVDLDALQAERDPSQACDPGTYKGKYKCTLEMNGMMSLPLEGDLSFELKIDETKQTNCPPGTEFCQDLVIAKGSGKLLGFALLIIGFETTLEGGLDCKTGKFEAKAIDGIWGFPMSTNPNDPNAPLTVAKPPSGMFDGTLSGVHLGGDPQKIEGMWSLHEIAMNLTCPGPFTVERQP